MVWQVLKAHERIKDVSGGLYGATKSTRGFLREHRRYVRGLHMHILRHRSTGDMSRGSTSTE